MGPHTMTTEKHSEKIKKSSRGGARRGAGRKPGSTNKVTAVALLEAIEKLDKPFEQGLAEDYIRARLGDDRNLVQKYQAMIVNKCIADKTEVDLTTAGQAIIPTLVFQPARLPDWSNDPKD